MEDDAAVVYGLEFQARVLTAQTAETEAIRFLVGTQSLKFDNQVHQIDFDDEQNLINKNVFLHREGEIWYISSSPSDKNILATCYNKMFESKSRLHATLWRIPSEFDTSMSDETPSHAASLEMICPLEDPEYETDTTCVLWHPANDVNKVISLTDNHILMWDIIDGQARISSTALLEAKGHPKFTNGKWNPHHNCIQIATANDTTIRGWDLRTMQQTYLIENAHSQLVRDLDFNPNKQYYMVSCGDDCKVRFWDVRNTSIPLKVLSDHSHWVWSVCYNHFHDQLVLTSSSDSRVILSNIVSISSEPFGHIIDADSDEDENGKESKEKIPLEDGVIATYEEHEDSVYAAVWSTADPWLFASLSYDGRLVINRVPRAEKYKILL